MEDRRHCCCRERGKSLICVCATSSWMSFPLNSGEDLSWMLQVEHMSW
jgi:hypothetical protein